MGGRLDKKTTTSEYPTTPSTQPWLKIWTHARQFCVKLVPRALTEKQKKWKRFRSEKRGKVRRSSCPLKVMQFTFFNRSSSTRPNNSWKLILGGAAQSEEGHLVKDLTWKLSLLLCSRATRNYAQNSSKRFNVRGGKFCPIRLIHRMWLFFFPKLKENCWEWRCRNEAHVNKVTLKTFAPRDWGWNPRCTLVIDGL